MSKRQCNCPYKDGLSYIVNNIYTITAKGAYKEIRGNRWQYADEQEEH